jgi:cellulose synthase (UDP-forming)
LWCGHERLVQIVALAGLFWGVGYLGWRIGWSGQGSPFLLFLALLAAELFGWVSLGFYAFLAWRVPPSSRPALPERPMSVDVFVCTYDEPSAVLEPTLVGCAAITQPHVTYVLDDGRRPEIRELAGRLGALYVTRADNSHAKAGNINHALGLTRGELLLCLDADHVPRPDILDATLGYFSEPSVALVQTPHDFLNRDSAQHTRPARHEQTLFYDVIAPGKDRHNAMFWCGSATVLRRSALEDVGGVLTDTVAEDFHTTIAMHAHGWRTHYHNEILVQGLAPQNLEGFLLQRARWARGNLAVLRTRQNPLTCPGLTATQRVSYVASLANYFAGLQRLALLLILCWTLATGQLPMHGSLVTLATLWLPWTVLAFAATNALGRGALGPLDSTRYGLMTMGIHLRGVLALTTTRAGAFKVTPKNGVEQGGWRVLQTLGLLTATGAILFSVWLLRIAATVGLVRLPPLPALAVVIVLALGAWELGCIAFVLGSLTHRRQLRGHYRFPVALQARIAHTATVVAVLDLTPDGLAFVSPVALAEHRRLRLLMRLPDTQGELHDLELPIDVQSCRPLDPRGYRIGCRLSDLNDATHLLLVEYCFVIQPARQLGAQWEPTTTHRQTETLHEAS